MKNVKNVKIENKIVIFPAFVSFADTWSVQDNILFIIIAQYIQKRYSTKDLKCYDYKVIPQMKRLSAPPLPSWNSLMPPLQVLLIDHTHHTAKGKNKEFRECSKCLLTIDNIFTEYYDRVAFKNST